jgi:hypothetical protein
MLMMMMMVVVVVVVMIMMMMMIITFASDGRFVLVGRPDGTARPFASAAIPIILRTSFEGLGMIQMPTALC